LALSNAAFAIDLPRHRSVPGGVAVLELGASAVAPQALVDRVPALATGDTSGWRAVIGIPLAAKPGRHTVVIRRAGEADRTMAYEVEPVRYAEQRLTVQGKHVDLSREDLARFEREKAHLAGVVSTRS